VLYSCTHYGNSNAQATVGRQSVKLDYFRLRYQTQWIGECRYCPSLVAYVRTGGLRIAQWSCLIRCRRRCSPDLVSVDSSSSPGQISLGSVHCQDVIIIVSAGNYLRHRRRRFAHLVAASRGRARRAARAVICVTPPTRLKCCRKRSVEVCCLECCHFEEDPYVS